MVRKQPSDYNGLMNRQRLYRLLRPGNPEAHAVLWRVAHHSMVGIGIGLMSIISSPWHAVLLYGIVFAIGNGAASLTPVGVMVARAFPRGMGIANAAVMVSLDDGK